MTDTPETNAACWERQFDGTECVDADFARELERDRDEARSQRDEAMEALDCLLTPIAGNKQALQEAFDLGLAVLQKRRVGNL